MQAPRAQGNAGSRAHDPRHVWSGPMVTPDAVPAERSGCGHALNAGSQIFALQVRDDDGSVTHRSLICLNCHTYKF
jgi:hypothetical protein